MSWKKLGSLLLGIACALGAGAAQPHVTTAVKHYGIWSIGTSYIYHIDPGGSVVVNTSNGNCYIEVAKTTAAAPSELWVEGGTVQAEVLALRGEYATCRVQAGTLKLTGSGILLDGGSSVGARLWVIGGTCESSVNFRKCAIAEFRMSGGKLVGNSVDGDNMDKANIYFDLTNSAYAVTGTIANTDRFAIKVATPITKAPKSLTITGTPVSGCAYALVDGITSDTFFASTTLNVPAGWELLRRDGKLFLVESAALVVKTATWTGAAGDGNPRTPGNWTCRDASGTVVEGVLPGINATAVVPADSTNFSCPKGQGIVLGELRFLGDRYELNAETDWRGLDFGAVTKALAVIDVKDQVLRVTSDPSATTQLNDLMEPTGTARLTLMGNSTLNAGPVTALFDNNPSGSSRLLVGNFQGCAIDYDFGAGKGEIVRGVRFYCPSGPRRPKALTISGTRADPAAATDADWDVLYTGVNLSLKYNGWTDYLTFDNETPYRAYRIKVTANISSDQYGNYLEFYEMEFVREARQPATEVTASVAGGELHFEVDADKYAEIAKTTLSGALKVVKEGEGTLGFKKTNQSFTGGVEAVAGILRTQGAPASWVFGGAPLTDSSATTITLREGTLLDLWAYAGWGYTTIVLDGGTIAGRTTQFNSRVCLTSSSTINAGGNFTVPAGNEWEDFGGNTLSLKIVSGSSFDLNKATLSNGVFDVVSGGWFNILQPLDARTVDLKMGAALNVAANAAVRDYVAKYANVYGAGEAELAVYGTFTPEVDYFYGCTLQNGSTINLASRTNEWLTTSRFTDGRRVVEFADDATVTIALGARRPARGERIVRWRTPPANLDSLSFAFALDDATATPEPAIATPTGVFYGCDPNVVDRAYWTGAVDGDVAKSANWACTNVANQGVADALPGSIATIYLAGDCTMNAPGTNDVEYAWIVCAAPVRLAADCDWRGLDLNRIQDGAVIDLRGHKLFVSGFNGDTARTLTITDSTTGKPGEFHVEVPQPSETEAVMFGVTSISIEGNTRLVKEGAGEFWMKREHQAYTGGTDVVAGRLRPDLVDPMNWPFGGDGIVDPGAMTITLREDGKFYPAGKEHWANATFIIEGGTLEDWTPSFNAKIVVNADFKIDVFSGDFVIPATADFCDLGGHSVDVTVQGGKHLTFYQPRLENGKLNLVSGGWLFVSGELDASTVDFRVGCALGIGADLSVHDYEAAYTANNNGGTNVMTVCGTFIPTTDYFYGCTLADGARIDLSSKTNVWSTTSAFTAGSRVVNFVPGARVGVLLGERQFEDGDQVIAWTEETAPADAESLKFKPVGHSGTLYVDEGGVYFRASGLVIFVR